MGRSTSQASDRGDGEYADFGTELAAEQWSQLHRLLIEVAAGSELESALRLALGTMLEVLGWSAAHARWETGGSQGTEWVVRSGDAPGMDDLGTALGRAPVAAVADAESGRPGVRLETLLSLPESRAREAARKADLAGYASLPVRAEGKAVALLEMFSEHAPEALDGGKRSDIVTALELLASQLGLVASRARMRDAVRGAAAHARRQALELEAARTLLNDRAGEPDDAGVDRSEQASDLYDARTGFPGRIILFDRLRQAVRRRQRSPRDQFAVVVTELGGLDRIRSRGGESAVEDVLVAAARRLAAHTRPADTTAVDGEDRYVMLIEGISSIAEAIEVAERARKELQRPFPATHGDVRIEAFVGAVLGGPAYDEPEALLADAIAAARRAAGSRQRIQVFDRTVEENPRQRERLRADLGVALERNELFLQYQPIVSLQDGRITGLETFVRWRHPELGVVPPNDFIPIAQDTHLIHDIGLWVLDRVCEQTNVWRAHLGSLEPPPVGINVTDRQLHAEGFLEKVREMLERHGMAGRQIRFDVCEADLMRNAGSVAQILDRLQGMGIRVAIDDFGTGFSSLSLLHELPVGALKIDRSFVSHRREKTRKWGVARTIVELARILEVDVIAEGIETREQFLALKKAGCTQAQGYHFSGPVDAEAAEEMIRDGYPLDLEAPSR